MSAALFRHRCHRWFPGLLCVLLLLPGNVMATPDATPQATPLTLVTTFPYYELDVSLDPKTPALEGDLTLQWTNATGKTQSYLYFRLYPNAAYYTGGSLEVSDVHIDGRPVVTALADDTTVLQVTPGSPVAPGATVNISLHFVTIIPVDTPSGFGIFNHASTAGIWNLADWYPILAGWEPGSGWYLEPPTVFGDPTFSETATYRVTISTPDTLTIIATGAELSTSSGPASGTRISVYESGPAREFAMTLLEHAASPVEATTGPVTVRVTLPESQDTPGLATFMADTAARAMETYAAWMGDYPEPEFDLTVAALSGANGVSWSGMTWFGLDSITRDGTFSEEERTGLAFVILHEVGHQWIASIVGSNNNDHGFMSEGLVNALAVLAARDIFGPERAELYLYSWVAGPYSSLLNDKRDGIADAPITNDTNGVIRSLLIYGKAAVGFIAIQEAIGEDAFLRGLGDYAQEFRFRISTPEDLRRAFERASGMSLGPLWAFWFNEATATSADLEKVLTAWSSSVATPIAA